MASEFWCTCSPWIRWLEKRDTYRRTQLHYNALHLFLHFAFQTFFSAIIVKNFAKHVLSDVSRSSCQASFIVPFSTKIGMVQQILIKRPKIKFHENSLSGYRISNGDRRTYTQIGVYKRAGEYLLTARPQCSVNINTSKGNGL